MPPTRTQQPIGTLQSIDEPPRDEIVLRAPPVVSDSRGPGTMLTALPALGGIGSVGYMFAGPRHPATYIAGGMFLVSSVVMVIGLLARSRGDRRRSLAQERRRFEAHLIERRPVVRAAARQQRQRARERHPAPRALPVLARSAAPRAPGDADFGVIRFGSGPAQLSPPLRAAAADPDAERDLVCARLLEQFIRVHSRLDDMPQTLRLADYAQLHITGDPAHGRGCVRAMLAQACTFHSPSELAVFVRADDLSEWEWTKWLPHARGRAGLHPPELREAIRERAGHSIVVSDLRTECVDPVPGSTTVITLGAGGRGDPPALQIDGVAVSDLDSLSRSEAEALARALARRYADGTPRHGGATAGEQPIRRGDSLDVLLGIDDPESADIARLRQATVRSEDRLRLPIGWTAGGTRLFLDVKEPAFGGAGPHGLVVGATGSGKSELLRTMVLGAALTHPPALLNFVLIDFKGGATFADLAGLPHVSALITNLQDDTVMVERMRDALISELNRRQALLNLAGHATSLRDYERRRAVDPQLPLLNDLLIVVDEFTELLAAQPDFIDVFVQLGRLGRSLGIHLLLATQRLDEGRIRGLDSHLSYRIALRTFSPAESRAAIGTPDASNLPTAPGHGYLRGDNATPDRFTAAHTRAPTLRRPGRADRLTLERFTLVGTQVDQPRRPPRRPVADSDDTIGARLLRRLSSNGPRAHRIWLPPLDLPDPLDAMHPTLGTRPDRGFGADPSLPRLVLPIGTVDEPLQQRRSRLAVDFSRGGAHLAVAGRPRSGKSTLLQTVVLSAALRHTPAEAAFYLLDFSDSSLTSLTALPHVGVGAAGHDGELIRRTVAFIAETLGDRVTGRPAGDDAAEVFLVIDGFGAFARQYDDLLPQISTIADRGPAYGVHLVISAHRWSELRGGLRELVGTRLELKLGDSLDSDIGRRAQEAIPADRPGRGLTPDGRHFLAAAPRADQTRGVAHLAQARAALIDRIARYWPHRPAPAIERLPTRIELAGLAHDPGAICLGPHGSDLAPLLLDPADIGLVTFADPGSGKTSLLRSIGRQVCRSAAPGEAKLLVIDYRRGLLGEFDEELLLGYAATRDRTAELITGLCDGLAARMPRDDLRPAPQRDHAPWTGPRVDVLVDDYDLVAGTTGNPLLPLLDYLPHARDVGLRIYLTRRAAGSARAVLDPIVSLLVELQTPRLLLSAAPEEGRVFGVRAARLPPGRGTYVDRTRGNVEVQLAVTAPRPPRP